jgi:hypothetical protein
MKMFFKLLVGFAIAISLVFCIYWLVLIQPYQNFKKKEQEIIHQLDTLNASVLQSLPSVLPDALILGSQSSGVISPYYEHGRYLYVYASITTNADSVHKYYSDYLVSDGWVKEYESYSDSLYSKGTSCVEFWWPTVSASNLTIVIWHDFRNQTFTPKAPNPFSMMLHEHGKTLYSKCP